jgi:hypothetical protein
MRRDLRARDRRGFLLVFPRCVFSRCERRAVRVRGGDGGAALSFEPRLCGLLVGLVDLQAALQAHAVESGEALQAGPG